MGIFGNLFDFNGDGELDFLEKAAELGALVHLFDSEETDKEDKNEKRQGDNYEL